MDAGMKLRINPPDTGPTNENKRGGIMIVMFPGYGPEVPDAPEGMDDEEWVRLLQSRVKARGLITSPQIDRGPAVRAVLGWFEKAGMNLKKEAPKFSIFIWPQSWMGYRHGPQKTARLLEASDEFVEAAFKRSPGLVVLLSCYMIDALNDPKVVEMLEPVFGEPVEKPRRITSTRLKAMAQRWQRTLMIALPIPGPSTTDEFVEDLVKGLKGLE